MTTEPQQAEPQQKQSLLKRQIGGPKQPKSAAPKAGKFNIPPRAQVNLMPPEVIEGRQLAVLQRQLVWGIIGLLVVVVLAFGAAYFMRAQAQQKYDDSLEAADALTAQKREYSPVIQVQSDIKKTTNARTFALSTEVNWYSYAYSIEGVLPEGVTIDTMSVVGIAPGEELAGGSDPLTQDAIAVISFSASSETLPDASEWIEALQTVPGLADINLQSSVLTNADGEIVYEVSATAQVTEEALALRTFPDQEPAAADDTDSEDEG